MTRAHEVNFDGLVGPTHNYAGLSYGNIASMSSKSSASSPKRAALEGLAKMKFMADLGLRQAVLPPHERPHVATLRRVGFTGNDTQVIEKAAREDPTLLAAVSSASAMWAANAATVSPSTDTLDRRVHFTPANLISNFHRSIEPPTTTRVLRTIFADQSIFIVHEPLPATPYFSDEGAANHLRLCAAHGEKGIEGFVYGWRADTGTGRRAVKYPSRQSMHASAAVVRRHLPGGGFYVGQHPAAIGAGAFHNDVVCVGNGNLLLYHEHAWTNAGEMVQKLANYVRGFQAIEVRDSEVPLADAISSYLFNSQLVTVPGGSMALVAPVESQENLRVRAFLDRLLTMNTPIETVHFVDVRQSMRNGGGPACLRLRVVLTESELAATHSGVIFTDSVHDKLKDWINRHYRDELHPKDLADPNLLDESRRALDELSRILRLGSIYEFQMTAAL